MVLTKSSLSLKSSLLIMVSLLFLNACKDPSNYKNPKKPPFVKKPEAFLFLKDMIFFEGETFTVGSEKGAPNEKTVFEKQIRPFYLDKKFVRSSRF